MKYRKLTPVLVAGVLALLAGGNERAGGGAGRTRADRGAAPAHREREAATGLLPAGHRQERLPVLHRRLAPPARHRSGQLGASSATTVGWVRPSRIPPR